MITEIAQFGKSQQQKKVQILEEIIHKIDILIEKTKDSRDA